MIRKLGYVSLIVLAACASRMTPEKAADVCEERARAAAGITGEIQVGIKDSKPVSGVSLSISSDYIRGADPYRVYDECVRQKSGQGPIRPLEL